MKSKIIKRIAGVSSIGLAGILVVGTILNVALTARAEETLFGIETLIQKVQSRENPYRILEIVPDEKAAEIGYYIPGYEPALSARQADSGEWIDWEEGLKLLKTEEERVSRMEELNAALQEFNKLRGFTSANAPVTYEEYSESEEAQPGYKELAFEEELCKGYFKQCTGESSGLRYYLGLYYAGNYNDDDTEKLDRQLYYVKDATEVTAGQLDELADNTVLYRYISDVGYERYERAGTWGELKATVSGGDATVSGGDEDNDGNASSTEDATGYYQLQIEHWQQGETPAYSALYAVESITQSAEGDFEFVETEDGFEYDFHTNSIYYKGGFVNNEWFHTKVMNMQPGQTKAFPIEVITLTPAELNAMAELPAFDMLYLNSGMQKFADSDAIQPYSAGTVSGGDAASVGNDISEGMRIKLFTDVVVGAKPCIVDAAILYTTDTTEEIDTITVSKSLWDTSVFRLAAMFMQKSPMDYLNNYIQSEEDEPVVSILVSNIVEDEDKNFVVEQTYSFYAPMTLISPDFDNPIMYKDGVEKSHAEGFKPVLDEILSENLNREADSSGEYKPLSTDVSQATAVRHIINYTYRRQIAVKESIRVLEIQPAKSDEDSYDLTEDEIMTWAPDVKEVQIDRMTTAEFIGKIEDINEIYDLVYIGTDRDHLNVVSGGKTVTGVDALLQNGDFENGTTGWNVPENTSVVTDDRGNVLEMQGGMTTQYVKVEAGKKYTLTGLGRVNEGGRTTLGIDLMRGPEDDSTIGRAGEVQFTSTSYTNKSFTFAAVEGTEYVKVYIWSGGSVDNPTYVDNISLQEVVTDMTKTTAGSTVFNDSSMDGLIYFHTGDLRYAAMELAGQLDTEYVDELRTNDVYYYNPVRYGGNDITDEKKEALLSFLNASYPIIISDEVFESAATLYQEEGFAGYSVNLNPGTYNVAELAAYGVEENDISSLKVSEGYQVMLYKEDGCVGEPLTLTRDASVLAEGWDNQLSSIEIIPIDGQEKLRTRKINEDHIDNSSFMYEFIEAAMDKTNFYARSDMGPDSSMFEFYLNRPKVSLTKVMANGEEFTEDIIHIYPQANDRYMLEYKFTIENEGAASANTLYECKLFIDVNADGKYSEGEELKDITITQNGKTVSSTNLYAGREYELRRYVPDGYKGVLPWKIQISQMNNKYIHNGVTGYTKLKGLERETLKILQICRDKVLEGGFWGGEKEVLFNLEQKIADPTDIYHILIYGGRYDNVSYEGISKDFDIDVDFMTISEFEAAFKENEDFMSDYNMLILGFSDAYGNVSGTAETGPLGAIIDFIESGKSVLFAHDTVSYFNYEEYKEYDEDGNGTVKRKGVIERSKTDVTTLTTQYHNSYNLTRHIRGLVGMDRYGITTYDELKKGVGLTADSNSWKLLGEAGKEMAYIPKSNKTATTGLTQGYTYSIINAKDVYTESGRHETFTKAQTGDGNFTNTYLNLDYGTVYYYDHSADDGEIKDGYNCEVSNLLVTKVNSGQITDYPYKLADEFMVSNTHGQYYQLDFTADDDLDGQSDLVVWYCLGARYNSKGGKQETIYSMSPNDVSNNYYIYNKGNITYTGVGHAGNTSTVEEAKLFINTMIASYNAGIKDPTISVLSDGTGDAEEIHSYYSYFDEVNDTEFDSSETAQSGTEEKQKLYFSVSDPNFVKGEREIALQCYYESKDEDAVEIVYEGKTIMVKKLPMTVYEASTNRQLDSTDNLTSGAIYYILFDKELMKNYDSKFSIYFEAQSTITTKSPVTKEDYVVKTGLAYNRFDYTKVKLFELE